MKLVFDIETDGLLPEVSTLHVCCTYDLDTQEEWYSTDPQEILSHLSKATHLIGHNIIDYDLPVLKKLLNWIPNEATDITDTLILSRLGNPDRPRPTSAGEDKVSPHSLGAWGYRVGVGKPDHSDWSEYSEEMLHRCREDVRINARIYPILCEETKDFGYSVALEHEVQRIMSKQERDGVYFDTDKALGYVRELSSRVSSIDERLQSLLPRHVRRVGAEVRRPFKKDGTLNKVCHEWAKGYPTVVEGGAYMERDNYIGGPFNRIEYYQTDLNSDKQVKEWLLTIGWKPKEWNTSVKTGERTSPKLTPESFKSLPENVGEELKARVTWRHRSSQIQGWINKCREDHCLSAGANTLGTNTGRMRHRTVVNVPKANTFPKKYNVRGETLPHDRGGELWYSGLCPHTGQGQPTPFGTEMRSLFCARPSRTFVGHDASGLELRMLAHYMNDEAYTEQILNGDIHSYNQRLAGLPTRDSAKTFIYALLYGAGDAKLGSIIDGTKNDGAKLRDKFLHDLPAFGKLIDQVKAASKRGWLVGLDGRKIHMRRDNNGDVMTHKALNTLLQGAGAIVMKESMVRLDSTAKAANLDFLKVIDMHDEGQADVLTAHAEQYGLLAEQSIRDAGTHFNLNIPLDAEYKAGHSWAETH